MTADRDDFVARRRPRWEQLERLISKSSLEPSEWMDAASLYRATCSDLARARSLQLPDDVVRFLDQLAGRAHNHLYGGRAEHRIGLAELLGTAFPRELRASWRLFLLATLLFYGPFLLGFTAASIDPAYATAILPEGDLVQMEEMYSGDLARQPWEDAQMAGFYVHNNVGIAFRCFATGALFGLGTLWYLVYNGLVLGTVFGYLIAVGRGGNLLTFAMGHAPWELTGIVVAGTAGLRMGWALVDTGGRTRLGSLRAAGPALYRLVAGAAAMLFVAAAVEGFWSASPLPVPAKIAFAAGSAVLVVSWIAFGGRRGAP